MVAVAATAAKMVSVAPAGIEGVSAAVNVVAAVPKVLEVPQTAIAATEIAAPAVKAAEVGAEAAKVAPEAAQAATNIDSALANGAAVPEQAMESLVVSPVANVEASTVAAEWADQKHIEILRTVQPQMAEWEKTHLPGDDIEGWIDQRAAAEKEFTVDEAVNRDVEEWKFHHSEPDKVQDKAAHADWEKQLAARTSESRQANEASYEQFLEAQNEKNKGLSKQEFMRLYAELLQKRAIADNLAMRLQKLRLSPHQTQMRKDILARAEAQLNDMRVDITALEANLQFDAVGNPWKQWIIPAAVGIAMAAGPMGEVANEA